MISRIVEMVGVDKQARFDTGVEVKLSPHYHLCTIYDVAVDQNKGVWLRVGDGSWQDLKANQVRANLVASSVLQRLKLMEAEKKKVNT
ncbi:MAG TPA: hypothetical protein VD996_02615 [Chitinophagaceae bacterium]|nr:hypothetical protein [Chitinophagaceae bacterium]